MKVFIHQAGPCSANCCQSKSGNEKQTSQCSQTTHPSLMLILYMKRPTMPVGKRLGCILVKNYTSPTSGGFGWSKRKF